MATETVATLNKLLNTRGYGDTEEVTRYQEKYHLLHICKNGAPVPLIISKDIADIRDYIDQYFAGHADTPKGCGNCGHRRLRSGEPPASQLSAFCAVGRHLGDWPSGAPACTSWWPAEDADHDQRNDEAAAKWDAQVDAAVPRMIVTVKGGLVQEVYCDSPIEVRIIDEDTDGADVDRLTHFEGREPGMAFDANVIALDSTPDPESVDHYWHQIKAAA